MINCDNGSEFINTDFKNILTNRGVHIKYVQVGSHHALGTIDRFIRTLREKVNKYMEMHKRLHILMFYKVLLKTIT